jgi:hypothetical protein
LNVDIGAVVKVCTDVSVFISVDMQLHQCFVTGVWSLLNRDIVTVEGIVKMFSEPLFANVCEAQESIPPAYVAWWVVTTSRVTSPFKKLRARI